LFNGSLDLLSRPETDDPTISLISAANIQFLKDAGFAEERARLALQATGDDPERALDWIVSHDPVDDAAAAGMSQAGQAIDLNGCTYVLDGFITHRGSSMHCGHYVAHLRQRMMRDDAAAGDDKWILYNDEKVLLADEPVPIGSAYIYLFTRQQSSL
jgi:ubiquitin carboxyl-terminal hydrolase 5/13